MAKFKIENELKNLNRALETDKTSRDIIVEDLLKSEDFFSWLFNPPSDDPEVVNVENKLYVTLSGSKFIKSMIRILEHDTMEYSRTAACYITSITKYAEQIGAEYINNCIKERKAGKMGARQFDIHQEKIDNYMRNIKKLRVLTKSIISEKAKEISKRSGLPKKLITGILLQSPGPKFISKYQLGTYVNDALKTIYTFIEENPEELYDIFRKNASRRWTPFFAGLFGESNLPDIAMIVLLEGFKRKKPNSSKTLDNAWNSITIWALDSLEDSDDHLREQMIELYIKRITAMFAGNNRSFDLRENLLTLDKDVYPKLAKTVSKYKDKIKPIITKK
jgi:uncharacterized membrane-anchored protein YjiN (DUF445 family)